MINHARTLLLNPQAGQNFNPSIIGEEFMPSDYVYVEIPRRLNRVRDILFGNNADRAMKNYRLREVMALLHSTELDQHVRELDSRITYLPTRNDVFEAAFGTSITSNHSVASSYLIVENEELTTSSGRLSEHWTVTVDSPATSATIVRHTPLASSHSTSISSPQTDSIALPGSDLTAQITNPIAGHSYDIKSLKRPARNLAYIAGQLQTGMGAAAEAELFYKAVEPYSTFENLWFKNPHLPYKLGGLLLALIYRLEDFRNGSNI
jgi:hypothetical protein